MALPTDDVGWVNYLARRHDAERPELEQLNRYYEGTQPLTYMHPEVLREVQDRIKPVVINWPQLVVDTVEERLDVEGFRLPDQTAADDDLWRVWQANDLDEQSQMGHVDSLVMRRSYVTVGTDEDDRDTPLVSVESPLEVYADRDPRTRQVRAALRRVSEQDTVVGLGERFATLYLPERTVWYQWDGEWREIDRDEHGLGTVPVVPLVNRARLRSTHRLGVNSTVGTRVRYGESELTPIIPLSDAASKLATDMMLAAEFVALPLRGIFGIGPEDLVDQNGNRLSAIQAIMGRLFTIEDENAKAFEFAAARLDNFHRSIEQLARVVAALAGLPPHYLGYSTENPASADAIRSAEARLVKRAERKQRAFGGSWEQVMRLVRRFQSGEWDPRLKRLEVQWRDAATPTFAQVADGVVKLYNLPRPLLTRRAALERLRYSDTEIKRMDEEFAEEARRDPLAEIARQTAGGGGQAEVDDADPVAEPALNGRLRLNPALPVPEPVGVS